MWSRSGGGFTVLVWSTLKPGNSVYHISSSSFNLDWNMGHLRTSKLRMKKLF